MQITKSQYKNWKNLLREIPVSVNNFYGDPTIQWNDTLNKLENLARTKHLGSVGIITKGKLTEKHAEELKSFMKQGLKIIVLISISELPQFEKVGMAHRYENIRLLNQYEIPNIAYIRPMTPPYNTSKETIDLIFRKLKKAGGRVIVASGFRGDENIVSEMNPDQKTEWVMRVKLMSKDVYQSFKENSEKYKIKLFTRTSCAVSYLCGDNVTYNPYYYSPNLVHCEELNCPLVKTCKPVLNPKENALDLIKFFGYDIEFMNGDCHLRCDVAPDNRLKCRSCCTTCFHLKGNRILVKGNVRLGDLTFIRFISGILTMQPGKNDNGDKDVGFVSLPNFPNMDGMQCLNSWWPYARIGDKCFDCKYCIEKYYGNSRRDYGFPPADLLDKIILEKNICVK
ncbi:hypothetical protein KKC32_02280 [Patescibacteria group bacterium]|nr:hypothetical protein [Patescibacteria group bacterium]